MVSQPYPDDEINLVDLWRVLAKRKVILIGVFAICLALSIVLAIVKSDSYLITTTLELGSTTEGGKRVLIDKPETILAKIQDGFIPAVLSSYAQTADDADKYKLTARVPKGSDVVVIEGKVKQGDEDTVKSFEEKVIAMVQEDHERILEVVRSNIKAELEKEQRQLEELKDSQTVIKGDLERTKVLSGLLDKQLADVQSLLDDATKTRKKARSSVSDATHAMTLLMLDNEIDQNRKRLSELQERRFVKIPDQQETLTKELSDNQRSQQNSQSNIEQVQIQLKNIRETRAVIPPTRSLEPVGLTKPLLVILGGLLGVILGIFAAFFSEFLAKAKEQIKEG